MKIIKYSLLLGSLVVITFISPLLLTAAPLSDKTLVAWASPANLTQRGGSVLTIQDSAVRFDGIVFGELAPAKWMAGSDFWKRTSQRQDDWPTEAADANTFVQIALVYHGDEIIAYRNGKEYSRHSINTPQTFGADAMVLIGQRHIGSGGFFSGKVEDARIYDRALNVKEITALKPNVEGTIKPWAWWNFKDGEAKDVTGRFMTVQLIGGAKVEDGKLVLNGEGAFLVAGISDKNIPMPSSYISPIHFRPKTGVFADPIPFYWKGEYHVFYLHGGVGKVPWEHIVSSDLVHWRELPPALLPDGAPTSADGQDMFTGSVVEKDGVFHIFYTGNNNFNPDGFELIMHATSPDLIHWTKHPSDIIRPDGDIYRIGKKADPSHWQWGEWDFRDPYVFFNPDEQCFWMVFLGNQAGTGQLVQGLATSRDLQKWEFQKPLKLSPGQECPDLFKIDDTWYLLGADRYRFSHDLYGEFKDPPVQQVIDRPRIYAGKTMFDGKRHIWVGWIWDSNKMRDEDQAGTWGGTMCQPRELYAGPDGQLYQRPVSEVIAMFTNTVLKLDVPREVLPDFAVKTPDNYMVQCHLQLDPGATMTLTMRQQSDGTGGYSFIMRTKTLEAELKGTGFSYNRRCTIDTGKPVKFQAFVQGSIIECFINDQFAYTCCAYDYPAGQLGLNVKDGKAKVLDLEVKTN